MRVEAKLAEMGITLPDYSKKVTPVRPSAP